MKKVKRGLKMMAVYLVSCLVLNGCSKEDGGGEFDFIFNVSVSPEGAGIIETNVHYVEYDVYRIELHAIPSAGFSFSHWEGFCGHTVNPCSRGIFTYYEESPYTVTAIAIFETIE